MDVVGSEIGQKMRSAIKAKLTELGCYVDDELPDYVMVMVANKRTRAQMEDDLQLFLGDNTELFVNWLHQVLKKLQEVTVTAAPLKTDIERSAERSVAKEKKRKDKEKAKKAESSKKAKKKEKEKAKKKEEKKSHKKKKSKHKDIMRPNIPPLLMNMEKESEPSITDVFAGQILKNHGVLIEPYKDTPKEVEKKVFNELKRPIVPIIDLESITTPEPTNSENSQITGHSSINDGERDEQIKEINQIEAKIQGLKQKLAEQLDSMSDDEDFLTIRTEAEELMNDFAEDGCQDITQPPPSTPPLSARKTVEPIPESNPTKEPELPQIELNLPKRPIRERLGVKEVRHEVKEKEKTKKDSPERFTPDKEVDLHVKSRSARSRLGSQTDSQRKSSVSEDNSEKPESSNKRLTSKVSVLEGRNSRSTCASVVLVRPRPRVGAPASSLLLRAVADAHKSLLNIPPKIESEPPKIKRALVLPMRRVEAQKIVIQVPVDTHSDSQGDTLSLGEESEGDDKSSKLTTSDSMEKDEILRTSITKVITNTEYVPSRSTDQDDTIVDSSTIHNATANKDKRTQFIVTMEGYHPNAFLAKKLKTEGILDEDEETTKESIVTESETVKEKEIQKEIETKETEKEIQKDTPLKKRLSDASAESDTQVILGEEKQVEKRKSIEIEVINKEVPPMKKRRASPIIFDVGKKDKDKNKEKEKEKEKEAVRERTISASSDSVTLTTSSHKYDSVPPLSQATAAAAVQPGKQLWCRSFPLCRFGAACAFAHPRCKFAAACTRRGCVYSHALSPTLPASPVLASHVVPAANYKSISSVALPSMCKYYPHCVNPACHFYHPKPCRFGNACLNKLECNFYHHDLPNTKFKYSV